MVPIIGYCHSRPFLDWFQISNIPSLANDTKRLFFPAVLHLLPHHSSNLRQVRPSPASQRKVLENVPCRARFNLPAEGGSYLSGSVARIVSVQAKRTAMKAKQRNTRVIIQGSHTTQLKGAKLTGKHDH